MILGGVISPFLETSTHLIETVWGGPRDPQIGRGFFEVETRLIVVDAMLAQPRVSVSVTSAEHSGTAGFLVGKGLEGPPELPPLGDGGGRRGAKPFSPLSICKIAIQAAEGGLLFESHATIPLHMKYTDKQREREREGAGGRRWVEALQISAGPN